MIVLPKSKVKRSSSAGFELGLDLAVLLGFGATVLPRSKVKRSSSACFELGLDLGGTAGLRCDSTAKI